MTDTPMCLEITVSSGVIRGAETDDIRRFLSVPYAKPPVGSLRWANPVAPTPWDGVRDATEHGATAPQTPYGGALGELLPSLVTPGDDFLTLSVWTPATAPAEGLPVMVWIHGGAFERGTAALPAYDGTTFARDGVVFVGINYRLGSEGFSVLEGAPLNLGLRDAAAALKWVHSEIGAFGGDASRITLVGESAGGSLVAALLSKPETADLVAGAIIQSGPLVADSPKRAGRATRAIAKKLGVAPTRDAFVALSPEQLLKVRGEIAAGSTPLKGAAGFSLAIDPESLPVSPHEALISSSVPLIIGTNTDEYRLWFTPADLARIAPWQLAIARTALRIPRAAERAYRAVWPEASTGEIFGQIATDLLLRGPAITLARARTSPTYVYEFAWESPARDLRAAHALEIGFVFNSPADAGGTKMTGPNPPAVLGTQMHGDWVRMLTASHPGWDAFVGGERIRRYDVATTEVALPRATPLAFYPAPRVR